ncbi:MAG TPA: PT domain-containing protein [Candidatus Limnocylindrales bacterium]|nr:PT domain-containing protein [Candidatus Limnocylindrales bacterium]
MDDRMIDLAAGDARLRQRLDAYADARLTPDIVSTARMRARVLAVAHRQADLARADAALTVVSQTALPGAIRTDGRSTRTRRSARSRIRRPMTALLAAALVLAAAAGTAFAARPGGALYEQRIWIETLTLPNDPSARAIAELARLDVRLREAEDAARAGDSAGAAAALAAYARIVEAASEAAIATQDEVAVAILEAGVGRNVEVLRALALWVPDGAADAISRAVQRAVERAVDRSDRAIERIDTAGPANGGHGGNGSGGSGTGGSGAGPDTPADPTAKPTKAPTVAPTPKPTKEPNAGPTDPGAPGGQGGENGPGNTPKPQPTPKRTPRN